MPAERVRERSFAQHILVVGRSFQARRRRGLRVRVFQGRLLPGKPVHRFPEEIGVAAALTRSGLGTPARPAQLGAGTVAIVGPGGRRITQLIAHVVYSETDAGGVRYASRVDISEECWSEFDTVEVWATSPEPLPAGDPELTRACTPLGLSLPPVLPASES